MALLDTIQNMKNFHEDWGSKGDPTLDFNQICKTLEDAIKELENYERLIFYAKNPIYCKGFFVEKPVFPENKNDAIPTIEMMGNKTKAVLIGGAITLGMIVLITTILMFLIHQI